MHKVNRTNARNFFIDSKKNKIRTKKQRISYVLNINGMQCVVVVVASGYMVFQSAACHGHKSLYNKKKIASMTLTNKNEEERKIVKKKIDGNDKNYY